MDDGGSFTPAEVVALLASHTVAAADHVSLLEYICIGFMVLTYMN